MAMSCRGMPRPYNPIVNNFLFSLKFVFKKFAHLFSALTIMEQTGPVHRNYHIIQCFKNDYDDARRGRALEPSTPTYDLKMH